MERQRSTDSLVVAIFIATFPAIHATYLHHQVTPLDWCSLKCPAGISHTMCYYTKNEATSFCWGIKSTMNAELRNKILNWHNKLRNDVANGLIGTKAANMRKLSWNFHLEEVATRWAQQCRRSHDKCRVTEHYSHVDQNIGWVASHGKGYLPPTEDIMKSWTSKEHHDSRETSRFKLKTLKSTFESMVKACIEAIGCGEVVYHQGGGTKRLLVCNYAPSNCIQPDTELRRLNTNAKNDLFIVGEPCSRCPGGQECHKIESQFTSLCQKGNLFGGTDQNLTSPFDYDEAPSNCLNINTLLIVFLSRLLLQ